MLYGTDKQEVRVLQRPYYKTTTTTTTKTQEQLSSRKGELLLKL